MSVNVKAKYSNYPRSCSAKVALENRGIPGRMVKDYYVTHYEYSDSPAPRVVSWWDGRVQVGEVSRATGVLGPVAPDQLQYLSPPWPGGLAQEMEDEAVSAVIARIQKMRDDGFNGAVFLGELSSTWGMFTGTATRVVNAWRFARRGNMSAARRALGVPDQGKKRAEKGAANNWLELQYGWLPLLSDIDAAARKLADRVAVKPRVFRVRGSSRRAVNTSTPLYMYQDSFHNAGPGLYTRASNYSCTVGVSYTVSNGMLSHAASLGFTNPLLLAWELLPLSFVFDWLFSVGDWLAGFSAFHGVAFYDGFTTFKGDETNVATFPGGTHTAYRSQQVPDGRGGIDTLILFDYSDVLGSSTTYSRSSGFRRFKMAAFPSVPLPTIDLNFGWKKVVTSWALIRQRA